MSEGWMAALAALLVAAGSVAINVIQALLKGRQANRDAVIGEYLRLLDERQKQIARVERVQEEQQRIIEELRDESAECDSEVAELWVWCKRFHDTAGQHVAALSRLGHDGEPLPAMPERPKRRTRAEFLARTAAQAVQSSKDAGSLPPDTKGCAS